MLYKKNSAKQLDLNLFKNPTCEYRGAPFWSWNCKMNKEMLGKQIIYLKEMGFGGYHMHSRTGMDNIYLGDEFMDLIKFCADTAEKENMLAWLYDEDRWASGAAGGYVTKIEKFRGREIIFTPDDISDDLPKNEALENGKPYFLAAYDVELNDDGTLKSYRRIARNDTAKANKWYAFSSPLAKSPWFNNESYPDTMDKEAIAKFIDVTYESYKRVIGDRFSKSVPAIFTDEPNYHNSKDNLTLSFANDKKEVRLGWSRFYEENYKAKYGEDILDKLPEVFWTLPDGKLSLTKYRYFDFSTELFVEAFADQCGAWCEKNNFALTGHVLREPRLQQTFSVGEVMRSYRSFQLPGIDMLCDYMELTTAKQCQSAVHQYGKEGMLSELYGVTNWDFDFRGHKFQGDWQAALGVTIRVPHLSWVSMAGEAKRDYPASIFYQSSWYKEYPYIEDHFARVNTALTRGKPIVNIGVIHPIESYWVNVGPNDVARSTLDTLEQNFASVTEWMLKGHADFDFISESLLPSLQNDDPRAVGKMRYNVIVVPGLVTMRRTTLDFLKKFKAAGGKIIFMGKCPEYVDIVKSDDVKALFNESINIDFIRSTLLDAISEFKDVDIRDCASGEIASNLIYNYREDGDGRWLFVAHVQKPAQPDVLFRQDIAVKLCGKFTPTVYDTITGDTYTPEYKIQGENTFIYLPVYSYDSVLLRLDNSIKQTDYKIEAEEKNLVKTLDFKQTVEYSLDEPNVLLLDMARYALDDEPLSESEEEILRLDNILRKRLGYPRRMSSFAQPWTIKPEQATHSATLEFTINSDIDYKGALLAIEDLEKAEIIFNGQAVSNVQIGYFTDEAIKTAKLPDIKKGVNKLKVTLPLGRRTNIEWCYILGDFGVRVNGYVKTITQKPETIGFGSVTDQGFAFYGANISYKIPFTLESDAKELVIYAPIYRGALISAQLDSQEIGKIVFSPYSVSVKDVKAGQHTLTLKLFGTRHNSFGALHNANTKENWFGPNAWRTKGDAWCYEYRTKPMGILSSPKIEIYK